MSEPLEDKQDKLFHDIWKTLYSAEQADGKAQDPEVRKAIRRMYDTVNMPEGEYEQIWNEINKEIREQKHLQHRWWRYAAVIILPLLLGGIAWYLWQPTEKQTLPLASYIRPQNGILLTLPDGRTLNLREQENGEVLRSQTVEIHKDSTSGIIYERQDNRSASAAFHTLEVPVAADYRLHLSDGTVVYMNSETTLKYPEVFTGAERTVYLEGEAYFEVARDAAHPFKVVAKGLEVEVLGTHFNINAYPDQAEIATTLTEGKVKVSDRGRQVVLQPGEQAIASAQGLEVRAIDVREFVSWKDGLFIFREMSLEKIMTQVYLWYGIKANFLNENIRHLTFTGVINKNLSAEELFRVIEKVVDVRFSKESDNRVMITTK